MQQIADRVEVHVTTVSRAVDDKWVQTPRGIFALKRFFGGGTTTADGEEVAWETIKQKLLEIIAKEDKQNPLSDEEIVDELSLRASLSPDEPSPNIARPCGFLRAVSASSFDWVVAAPRSTKSPGEPDEACRGFFLKLVGEIATRIKPC